MLTHFEMKLHYKGNCVFVVAAVPIPLISLRTADKQVIIPQECEQSFFLWNFYGPSMSANGGEE